MSVTDILKKEHRGIERMLNVVEEAALRLERGDSVPKELFAQAAEFFSHFADRCHHGKEEKQLFPLMERRGVPSNGGPIGVMLQEHTIGRGYIRAMREESQKLAASALRNPRELLGAVRGYVDLLRQHIQKEDNILFHMADQVLTAQDQKDLAEAFDRVEREEMGVGEHERYHAMIDEMEDTLLH